jgi:hypothetical protein
MRASLTALFLLLAAGACGPGDDDADSCSGMVAGDLVITEVLADYDGPSGSAGDEGKEWFEIHNASSRTIELAGVLLEHGRPTDVQLDNHVMRPVTLAAGEYLVLGNAVSDLLPGHVDYGYAGDLGSLFNTEGGRLALRCGTTIIDEAVYDQIEAGHTRQLDGGSTPDYIANDDLNNWCEAEGVATYEYEPANFGTPGAPNQDCMVVIPGTCDDNGTPRATIPPQVGDLTITEVHPDPNAVADAAGEWFEVRVNNDVDLNDLGIAAGGSPIVLSSASCVRVTTGTYLVFAKNADMQMNGGLPRVDGVFTFQLANGGGMVRVLMGTTELDAMTYPAADAGTAIQLDMGLIAPTDNDVSTNLCDATATFGGGDRGTPGLENTDCGQVTTGMCMDTGLGALRPIVKPTAGQLVINEWMPDPTHVGDAAGEWFELRATADVDLNGIQGGGASLGTTPLIPAGGNCVRVATGGFAVFARSLAANGLPTAVVPVATFGFGLTNGASSFQIGIDGANLATATWATASVAGSSWMIDSDGTQCTANTTLPVAVPPYNNGDVAGTDRGTPNAANGPNECP